MPEEEQFKDIFPRYETFMKWLNFDQMPPHPGLWFAGTGAVKERPQALQQAVDLAKTVMGV